MNYERTEENPLLAQGAVATGFKYISPCCTASVSEFRLPDGSFQCIGSVAGHGFGQPWAGRVEDINDSGYIVSPDGKERYVSYDQSKDEEMNARIKARLLEESQ